MSSKKIFVLDTNIILQNAESIFGFGDNVVVIPGPVIAEIKKKKNDSGEVGYNARSAARIIEDLMLAGNLAKGVSLKNGGKLLVVGDYRNVDIPDDWDNGMDYRILQIVVGITNNHSSQVVLVTNDSYLKIKANSIGIPVESYKNESVNTYYTGRHEIEVPVNTINSYYNRRFLTISEVQKYSNKPIYINEYILLKEACGNKSLILFVEQGGQCTNIYDGHNDPVIKPRNLGQQYMYDALFRNSSSYPLTIIKGPAGTGKTLFALNSGLNSIEKGNHKKILYLRGNTKLDDDIGYLPGTEQEKMDWALRPVRDNLEILLKKDSEFRKSDIHKDIEKLLEQHIIEIEAVAHMRGRSINNAFVIIDEAQNLTPNQIKTLLSRSASDTKIVLLGDPYQIDHPYLNFYTNGLSFASEKMKGSNLTIQVALKESECERSELSMDVLNRMGWYKW